MLIGIVADVSLDEDCNIVIDVDKSTVSDGLNEALSDAALFGPPSDMDAAGRTDLMEAELIAEYLNEARIDAVDWRIQ